MVRATPSARPQSAPAASLGVEPGAGGVDVEAVLRGRDSADLADAAPHLEIAEEHRLGPEEAVRVRHDLAGDGPQRPLAVLGRQGGDVLGRRGRRPVSHDLLEELMNGRRGRRRGAALGGAGAGRPHRHGRQDQVARVGARGLGQGGQLRRAAARRRLDAADPDGQRAARQGGAERHEMPPLQLAEHLRLAALQPEQVGGAGHVDVEEGAAHQEVGGLGGDVLGELGQALRRDDAREAALAAAAHEVRHGAERQTCAPPPTRRPTPRGRRAAPRRR